MIRKFGLYFSGLVLALMLPACEKNVDIEPPTAIDAAAGFSTRQDVDAALVGCYNSLQSPNYHGLRFFLFGDLYTDNVIHTGTFPSFAQIANKAILPDNVEVTNMWNQAYSGINRCNNVIASAPNISDPAFNNAAAIAEARCLRAFHYMSLLSYFGGSETGFNKGGGLGVPIIQRPTLSPADAAPQARATEDDVWTFILADLDNAIANLPNAVGTGRLNKRAATALKARAHLYRGEYAAAEAAANEVITTGGYTLVPGATYTDLYLKKNSSESIWELQFDANNTNQIAFFFYPTSAGGRNEVSASAGLRTAHTATDVRLPVNVIASGSLANKTQKYSRIAGDDNVIMVRLAEMYLIRAEARLWQNKVTEALEDLNVITARANSGAETSTDVATILDRIVLERRLEFAHEGAHRYFDLRRLNRLSTIGITQTFRNLWPLPQREVLTSEGVITQNPGY